LRAVVVPLVQLLFIEYANDGSLEHVVDLIDVVFDIVDVVKPKRSNRQAQTQGQAQVED
jgi:hypothetical protein